MGIRLFLTVVCLLCAGAACAQDWESDAALGGRYECTTIDCADDYSGKVKTTVVRRLSDFGRQAAVLYVHGYNDYFFQRELGDNFANNGYNFYAVDLRKYGRSIIPGQSHFEVRDLREYFEDLDAALDIIVHEGNKTVILMGHSTGGLIASYYLAEACHEKYPIEALILNSPFLDMNLDAVTEDFILPVVGMLARFFPDFAISQGGGNLYARTLLRRYGGEWDYDLRWKHEWPQDVTMGWLRAITQAQDRLHRGVDIDVPILLMHSDKSGSEAGMTVGEARRADIVLDVSEIAGYGRRLGCDITEYVVKDGMHDLFLSGMPVRYTLYSRMFRWLRKRGL